MQVYVVVHKSPAGRARAEIMGVVAQELCINRLEYLG